MRFLLTGGAGFIGSHTCVALLNAGHEVVVLDNYINSSPEALRRVEKITGKHVTVYEGDCCSEADLDRVLNNESIDAAVHFAGLKAVGESVHIPLEYYRNNLNSTIALCNRLAAHGVKRIVFSSSATVYGDQQPPMREDMPLGFCSCPYAWTKWMNEQILRDAVTADPEWSVVLLRYFNPVGAHESGLIGEDPSGIPNNLMPLSARPQQECARNYSCSATIIRLRTEPASVTISMSWILPKAMSKPWNMLWSIQEWRHSTSAPVKVTVYTRS